MKKFNLLMMATLVAFGSLFTSCSEDSTSTVTITLESVSVNPGTSIIGTINAEAGLETVKVISVTGSGESSIDVITSFSTLPILKTATGVYSIVYPTTDLSGNYKITAIDKDNNESSVNFTVGSGTTPTLFSDATVSTLSTAKVIYCLLGDGSTTSAFSINTGTSTLMSTISATPSISNTIDFVYWNNSTNNQAYTIYAPSAIQAFTSTWSTKNATKFATSSLDFDSATEAEVTTAANATTATQVSDLAVGSVVVFKTASTSTAVSKIGMFKVTARTDGYTKDDKITISVRVAK